MRASTLAKPSLMFAMAGLATSAHATTLIVDYSPTAAGTDITIGASATPQFDFFAGDIFGNGNIKDYIAANGASTVSGGGDIAPQLSVTAFIPGASFLYQDGPYPITFDIGADTYVGTFTVDDLGQHISEIDYTPAVPEPATWAMMLLGMGAIGAALRTRRQDEDQTAIA